MHQLKYRPDIDGLRALAVAFVVIYHAFPGRLEGGFVGVDIFFVISGYLISSIILKSLSGGSFSILNFYERRAKRILPGLFLVLALCLLFGWFVLLADEYNQLAKHVLAGSTFTSNLVLWSESGYFDSASITKPLLHLWSLGIEEQFYIFWPILLFVFHRNRLNLACITLAVLVTSFIYCQWVSKADPVAAFYSPLSRSWELMFGAMLAWLTLYKPKFIETLTISRPINNSINLAGFLLIICSILIIHKQKVEFPGAWALMPVLGSSLIIISGPNNWLNKNILSNNILVWVGLISYPLYLWHWPILSYLRIITSSETPSSILRISAVLLSIFLAWLTVEIIEKPIRYSTKRLSPVFLSSILLGIPILGTTGFFFMNKSLCSSHNFETRFIKRDNFEDGIGCSLEWFKGKDNWLFLGNAFENSIAKLKLKITPPKAFVSSLRTTFTSLVQTGAKYNTQVVLFVGPEKTSIYPEYLPQQITPSPVRYLDSILRELETIPNLIVYDPTPIMKRAKLSNSLLYFKTDTHWNQKGAFVAFQGFANLLNVPSLDPRFTFKSFHKGDLIDISKLKDFPYQSDYDYDVHFGNHPQLTSAKSFGRPNPVFGDQVVVTNKSPLDNRYVWIVGDSFSRGLREYFNSTFSEVRYVGHWVDYFESLPRELESATRKPDLIVIVRVERSF